jgi:hypothetical protein
VFAQSLGGGHAFAEGPFYDLMKKLVWENGEESGDGRSW